MKKYKVTVRTAHGVSQVFIEARNCTEAKDLGAAYGQVLSVVPA